MKKKKNNHLSDPRHRLKDQVFHESGGLVRRALRLGERHEPQRERREVRRQAVPDHSVKGGGGEIEKKRKSGGGVLFDRED